MDDFERRIGLALQEPGEPPADLAGRIHRRIGVRRRRRRYMVMASAAAAAAVAIAAPMILRATPSGPDPAATVASSPSVRCQLVNPATGTTKNCPPEKPGFPWPKSKSFQPAARLGELADMSTAITINAVVKDSSGPGSDTMRNIALDSLSSDGTVLGGWMDASVYRATPSDPILRRVDVPKQGVRFVEESGIRAWIEPRDWNATPSSQEFVVKCHSNGQTRQIGDGRIDLGPWLDGGTLVWQDTQGRAFVAKGCGEQGRLLPDHGKSSLGQPKAFSYPDLFLADQTNDRVLRQVNVDSGEIVAERPLPEGVRPTSAQDQAQPWLATANREVFAYVAEGVLRVVDRKTWDTIRRVEGMPRPTLGDGDKLSVAPNSMTIGARLVVYRNVVHDMRTGLTITLPPGFTYAAGDWLVWLEHDLERGTYNWALAKVRAG